MKKCFKVISAVCILSLLFSMSAMAAGSVSIKIPDSITHYNSLAEQEAAHNKANESGGIIKPQVFMGYEYVGPSTKENLVLLPNHARISGTMFTLVEGSTAKYVRSVYGTVTKETSWSVGPEFKFNIKAVEAEIKGNYANKRTVTTYNNEQWQVDLTKPGRYAITWWMVGHQYDVKGKCKVISSDSSDGTIKNVLIGKVSFPTNEVHLETALY